MSRHTQSPAKRHNNKRVAIFSSDESASDYDDGGGEDSDIQWMERPRKVQKKEKEKRDAPRARDPPRTGAGAGESKSSSVKQHTPPKTDSKAKSSHKSNNPDAETVKSSTSETPSSPASEEKKQKSRPYTADDKQRFKKYIDAKKDFAAIRRDVFPDRSHSSVRDFVIGQFKAWKALK